MIILGIDPGSEQSAILFYDTATRKIYSPMMIKNELLVKTLQMENPFDRSHDVLVCEHIECMGMAVGKTVFETAYWIGHFRGVSQQPFKRIYRHEEKMHLCGSMKAKDSNIRQALIDKFPATGGGKCPQVGTKKQPGPLFGVSGDISSALSVAITYSETKL